MNNLIGLSVMDCFISVTSWKRKPLLIQLHLSLPKDQWSEASQM